MFNKLCRNYPWGVKRHLPKRLKDQTLAWKSFMGGHGCAYCIRIFVWRRVLRMDVENVIVNGVEWSQPAELCEVFRNYFSSTFRKDEGNDPKLNYSAISRMQHFTISDEDVHQQLINLNPRKSEGADEVHPRILTSLAHYLAAPL